MSKYTLKTLKEISLDSINRVYMSESGIMAIDFDKFKEDYAKENKLNQEFIKSVDAIKNLEKKDKIVFIEFKNKTTSERETDKIRLKYISSLLLYSDNENKNINDIKSKAEFVLVYDEGQNKGKCEKEFGMNHTKEENQTNESCSRNEIAKILSTKANESFVFFGFNKAKGYLYKNVYTFTKEEFDKYAEKELK
ncbi:MAG: hypothetical protein MR601_04660 [Erysipelotrichaceae bacterium]|nr:hypothetical protein [Erysipelotrichaceae bacterium]